MKLLVFDSYMTMKVKAENFLMRKNYLIFIAEGSSELFDLCDPERKFQAPSGTFDFYDNS